MGAVPALAEFDAAASGGAQTRLFPPPEDFALLALQQLANAMQVGSHHRQRNDALKAASTMTVHSLQTSMLKIVDRRLHSRMLSAHCRKLRFLFSLPLRPAQITLARQRIDIMGRPQPKANWQFVVDIC